MRTSSRATAPPTDAEPVPTLFGLALQILRVRGSEVADEAGVSRGYISHVVRGRARPSARVLAALERLAERPRG